MKPPLLIFLLASAVAADTVTLAPKTPGGANYQVPGTITDYRGDAVVVERPGGSVKSYSRERVVQIETEWPAAYTAARQAIARRAWAAAAEQLNNAAREEQRVWARRQMLIDLMRCQMALGRWEGAGEMLVLLDKSDPTTTAWDTTPLAWFGADYVRPQVAERWLADSQHASARLLGASWLLATPRRVAAEQELDRLTQSSSPIIASLAAAQRWRTSLARVTERQADAWQQRVDALPARLQAGPQHVLAQAYYRLARYDAAALAALQGPLTGTASRELAARGLVLAGRATQKNNQPAEARRLWAEVRDNYADTPLHADAVSLLKTL